MRLWLAYGQHCAGDHSQCVDEKRGLSSRGDAPCKGQPAKLNAEQLQFLHTFQEDPKIVQDFNFLLHGSGTHYNESLHARFNIY